MASSGNITFDNMIIYKPTKQIFQNRLEAKLYFGSANFHRLIRKQHLDFIFTNNQTPFANNEYVYTNTQQNQPAYEEKQTL